MHCSKSDTKKIVVHTPQRRANYNDKSRLKRGDLQESAFKYLGLGVELNRRQKTAIIKKKLHILGIKLDLRLTSAWDAIVFELLPALRIVEIPPKPQVGYEVFWNFKNPKYWYIEPCFPLKLLERRGRYARLEVLDRLVLYSELELA